MNAPLKAKVGKAQFVWDDPLLLDYLTALNLRGDWPLQSLLDQVSAYDLAVFRYGYRPAQGSLTTLLTAVILYAIGSGPVKGFAVTLSIGLIVSMFTAVVVTRWIFDYVLMTRPVAKLSI